MDFKQAIKEIKVLLGMETQETSEVKFETAKLKDSEIVVEYENLEVGTIVYIVTPATEETEETKNPAPEGTHELEDGTKITVDVEGKITEVVKPEVVEEEENKEEETEEVKAKKEFMSKFFAEVNDETQNQLNWLGEYVWNLETKIWILEDKVKVIDEINLKLAKIEGAIAAMFGQFETMEPMVSEFSAVKERIEAIENTPGGKSIFNKESKETKELTLAEQRVEAIKKLRK